MHAEDFTHEEIVKYATTLYGDDWRTSLAENLNMTRKQLVLTLASGDPVPQSITVPFFSLLEQHLQRQAEVTRKIESRLLEIQATNKTTAQPRVMRRTAS